MMKISTETHYVQTKHNDYCKAIDCISFYLFIASGQASFGSGVFDFNITLLDKL